MSLLSRWRRMLLGMVIAGAVFGGCGSSQVLGQVIVLPYGQVYQYGDQVRITLVGTSPPDVATVGLGSEAFLITPNGPNDIAYSVDLSPGIVKITGYEFPPFSGLGWAPLPFTSNHVITIEYLSSVTGAFPLVLGGFGPGPGGTPVVTVSGTTLIIDLTGTFFGAAEQKSFAILGFLRYGPKGSEGAESGASTQATLLVADTGAIASVLSSSVPTALAQRELALGSSQTALHDFNGRLFRHRAGSGSEEDRTEDGEGDGGGLTYHEVMVGEGDGESGKGTKVVVGLADADARLWEVFTSFDYGNFDLDANRDFLGLQSDTFAESVGIERVLTEHLMLGAGVSYLESFSDQSTDVEGVTLAAYLSGTWGGFYADLLYGATMMDHDIDRDTGVGATAHADPGSVVHAVNFNTGYNFRLGPWVTGPYAGVDYAHAEIDGYTERGGGTAATAVSEQSVDSLITRVGWQVSRRGKTSWGAITPQVRVGWERENLSSDDALDVGLLRSPYYLVTGNTIRSAGGSFDVTVPGQDRENDFLVAGGGVRVEVGERFHVMVDYDGYFLADGYAAHFGKVSVGWRF